MRMEPVSASNIRLLPNTVVLLRDWRLNYQELDCKAFLVLPMDNSLTRRLISTFSQRGGWSKPTF